MSRSRLNWLLSAALILSCPGANALGFIMAEPVGHVPVRPVQRRPFVPHAPVNPAAITPVNPAQIKSPPLEPAMPPQIDSSLQAHRQKSAPSEKPLKAPTHPSQPAQPAALSGKSAAPSDEVVKAEEIASAVPMIEQASSGVHLQSETIRTTIKDYVAKTFIAETFKNDTDHAVEGTYLFPLPKDAVFSSFSLYMDGKPVAGKILEASEARRTYENIVRLSIDPGLLEYADHNAVRAKLFPIPPHGTRKVELEYTQLLKSENGLVRYDFPLKAEDRSNPIQQVRLDCKISSAKDIRTIWSPSYRVESRKTDEHNATVSYQSHNSVPDKNFSLFYSLSNKELAADLVMHKDGADNGYFLLALTPPLGVTNTAPKDVLLVADASGSMTGDKMKQARSALKYIVGALADGDRFNIVRFNTDVRSFKHGLVAATPANRTEATSFIDAIEAKGGTNISEALTVGADMLKEKTERPVYMIFTTDGTPTVGDMDISNLISSFPALNNVRIFDFGLGYDVNTRLLDKLAERHHGRSQYIEPDGNLHNALSGFYRKISRPVLTDVKVSYEGIKAEDVYPAGMIDIFAGEQTLLLGRYTGAGKATVVVSGKIAGHTKTYSVPVVFTQKESGNLELPRLWAMRRIGHLSELAEESPQKKQAIEEIVSLSKTYGIVSPYASMLVTDPKQFRLGEMRDSIMLDSSSVETGLEAVRRSKMLSAYKASSHVEDSTAQNGETRTAGNKVFYLKDGVWTDASYDSTRYPQPESVGFGSKLYFSLIDADLALAKYFAVGKLVIVVQKGHCYKIVQTASPESAPDQI